MFSPRPKPTRETLALEVLILDERLQMRDLGGALYDADAAQEYAARMEEGDTFPPVEVVREKRRGKQPFLWVFSGFTRVGAYTLRQAASVECLVYEGTFDDALFYALSENRKHGQASRPGDKAKAVAALLDAPNLMARVREAARERDMRRVIAAACGVGESTVTDELNRRGVRIQGNKLLPKETVSKSDENPNERGSADIKAPVQPSPPASAPAEPASAAPAGEVASGAVSQTVSGSSAPDSSAPTAPAGAPATAPAKSKAPPAVPRPEGAIIADLLADVCRRLDEYATTADGRWLQDSAGVVEVMRELVADLAAEHEPVPGPDVDGWGIPIQPHAVEAFAAVPKFKELVRAIRSVSRLFDAVANLPGAHFLRQPDVSSCRRGKKGAEGGAARDRFVHSGLERALAQVKAATPTHTVCPFQYTDVPHVENCPCCFGLNWTPVLSQIPPVCISRAKAAFGVKVPAKEVE